jgi:hypothetical protein
MSARAPPDESWQFGILHRVLVLYPERLSADELRLEILADRQDFSSVDAHDRAVRDLIAAGLLRRDGDSIVATHAAIRLYELAD